ncbi:MAG: IS200/IS605 family transposase, partial [Saprospiraceae bacterium]|nr:IS200/IS605 family transposase [Saprospiraceae bacterium]
IKNKPYYLIRMKIEYNNLYTHFIFTTLHRQKTIPEKHRERIEKFITGVVKNYDCKLYAIYVNPEHIHFLVSRTPNVSEDNLANIIANSSKKFINENNLSIGVFEWQNSASAFSVSKSDVDKVCKYILNQKEHHIKVTFKEEYEKFIEFYEKTIQPIK